MRDDKYRFHPREFAELATDAVRPSLVNEPIHEDVGVLVPRRRRSLHALIAQALADTESLIARLELGVQCTASGRALVRDLYVSCRRQREVLAAALRLDLE
jgi:hypothetical protein